MGECSIHFGIRMRASAQSKTCLLFKFDRRLKWMRIVIIEIDLIFIGFMFRFRSYISSGWYNYEKNTKEISYFFYFFFPDIELLLSIRLDARCSAEATANKLHNKMCFAWIRRLHRAITWHCFDSIIIIMLVTRKLSNVMTNVWLTLPLKTLRCAHTLVHKCTQITSIFF